MVYPKVVEEARLGAHESAGFELEGGVGGIAVIAALESTATKIEEAPGIIPRLHGRAVLDPTLVVDHTQTSTELASAA